MPRLGASRYKSACSSPTLNLTEDAPDERTPVPARGAVVDDSRAQTTEEHTQSASFFEARWHSGPLPSAEDYGRYESVHPGSAERILALAERAMVLTEQEAAHRHQVEDEVVGANLKNQNRGQIIAAVLAFIGLVAGITFIALGQSVEGLIALLVPLGAFVSRFLGRHYGD